MDRLKREFNVACESGAPQVNYRESISRAADIKYTHKKQSGGSGQFAEVAIKFEPGESGTGFEFRSEIKGGAVSHPFASHLPSCSFLHENSFEPTARTSGEIKS